jgi:hypothetical protein
MFPAIIIGERARRSRRRGMVVVKDDVVRGK